MNMHKILFTRSLPEDLVKYGKEKNLQVIHKEFIQIQHNELTRDIINLMQDENYPNWVFTSQNAVKIIVPWLQQQTSPPLRNCFAVGEKTAQRVAELGYISLFPEQQDANHLVKLLIEEKPHGGFLYFCGNLKRNVLQYYFQKSNIPYKEVEVYRTSLVQPQINPEDYDAICFCSPSAVESFYRTNKPDANMPCFAIGETTACSLIEHTDKVIISEITSLSGLIDTCHDYLNTKL